MLAGLPLVEVFDFDYNCLYRPRANELYLFNLFVSNAPFLYPLKTENLTVFWCFQGIEKGCIEKKWVKMSETIHQFKKQYFFYYVTSFIYKMLKQCERLKNLILMSYLHSSITDVKCFISMIYAALIRVIERMKVKSTLICSFIS